MVLRWLIVAASSLFTVAVGQRMAQSYFLPSLNVDANQDYLVRGQTVVLSCKVGGGSRYKRLTGVQWLLDGLLIVINDDSEFVIGEKNTLNITGQKPASEGEYQCQGILEEVNLANYMKVNATLISSPIKLRRARITRFEKVPDVSVIVRTGSVARLPCPGMPDVIPGPPEIFFEREGTNESVGLQNSRYISSSTGMQIAMTTKDDSGTYYCLVRNDYIKIQRRAISAVRLKVVEPGDREDAIMLKEKLEVVYPTQMSSYDRPIVMEVVYKNDVLIECVMNNAKITWEKFNGSSRSIITSDRFSHVFGNLVIKDLNVSDSGIYICRGQSLLDDKEEVVIYYELIVHQPSDVYLSLSKTEELYTWELSCLARNLRYEIPMVYVNATPLIDAVETMGVPKAANFYTNPINVTMMTAGFMGSVQCISRPAMEEAEIYGMGLEKGKSKNVYVLPFDERENSLIRIGPSNTSVVEGRSIKLNCLLQGQSMFYWTYGDQRISLSHSSRKKIIEHNLHITNATLEDEGWYTCVAADSEHKLTNASAYLTVVSKGAANLEPTQSDPALSTTTTDDLKPKKKAPPIKLSDVNGIVIGSDVRLTWIVDGDDSHIASYAVQSLKEGSKNWKDLDPALGHIRAKTIQNLEPLMTYKFRVTAINYDKTASASSETKWLKINQAMRVYKPNAPKLLKAEPLTPYSIRLYWHFEPVHNNSSEASGFVISYGTDNILTTHKTELNFASHREHTVTGLSSNTTYSFAIMAINSAGPSEQSNIVSAKTLHPDEAKNGLMSLLISGLINMMPGTDENRIHILILLCIFPLLIFLLCCVCCCRYRSSTKSKGANKFIDASYHIYNQQKVHRNNLKEPYDPKEFFGSDNIDEHLPLRGNNNEDRVSLNSRNRFRVDGRSFPNLYGRADEESDEELDGNDHLAGLESHNHYGMMMQHSHHPYNSCSSATARCYSSDTGMSREVIVPLPPPLLSNGGVPLYQPTSSTPLPPIPPLISATCSPMKAATVSYKTGDNAVVAYSPASIADSGGSGSAQTRTTNADSPTHPLTDGSDNGGNRGDSSRNSQISSVDGRYTAMNTFKSSAQPFMSTFAR